MRQNTFFAARCQEWWGGWDFKCRYFWQRCGLLGFEKEMMTQWV